MPGGQAGQQVQGAREGEGGQLWGVCVWPWPRLGCGTLAGRQDRDGALSSVLCGLFGCRNGPLTARNP